MKLFNALARVADFASETHRTLRPFIASPPPDLMTATYSLMASACRKASETPQGPSLTRSLTARFAGHAGETFADRRIERTLGKLTRIQMYGFGDRLTEGLPDDDVRDLLPRYPQLGLAVDLAYREFEKLRQDRNVSDLLLLREEGQIPALQERVHSFYDRADGNPYVPLAGCGPWLVTSKGAVIHDSGGYGMLAFGHAPEELKLPSSPFFANVMTASFAQRRLMDALRKEIGPRSAAFLNDGSSAISYAFRTVSAHSRLMTDPSGPAAGRRIALISLKGSFHGRTGEAASLSDSSRRIYEEHLGIPLGNQGWEWWTVRPNDEAGLKTLFEKAEREGFFVAGVFVEPVMGEGDPGLALAASFYRLARDLTRRHGSFLVVDSIQAGLRAHGVLSVTGYPGLEGEAPPDIETFAKAINGGAYPFSIIALTPEAARVYRRFYGSTMTGHPQGCAIATTVLGMMTEDVRRNIRRQGQQFLQELSSLQETSPNLITKVQGTGLLLSISFDPKWLPVTGPDGLERRLRRMGIGAIHGGENALRLTPHFRVTDDEIALIVRRLQQAIESSIRERVYHGASRIRAV